MNEYFEADVMRVSGLTKNDLRAQRKVLQEGLHWYRKPRNVDKRYWPIVWTQAGLDSLCKVAGIDNPDLEQELSEVEPPREVFGVVKSKFRNPRLIRCVVEMGGKGEEVMVLVRDSKNFVVGMKVPLRSDGQRWVAAKHPRFGGKW
jgi:hypothetical protein